MYYLNKKEFVWKESHKGIFRYYEGEGSCFKGNEIMKKVREESAT